jgi:hypothetical protein
MRTVFGSAPVWPPGLNEAAHHAKHPAQAHTMRHCSQACTSTINHMLAPCILLLLVSGKTFKWMVMDAMRACVIDNHQHALSASAHLRSLGRRLCHRVDAQLDDLCSKVFFTLSAHSICGHNRAGWCLSLEAKHLHAGQCMMTAASPSGAWQQRGLDIASDRLGLSNQFIKRHRL